jgi:uncharacterized protein (TIGR03067 family)
MPTTERTRRILEPDMIAFRSSIAIGAALSALAVAAAAAPVLDGSWIVASATVNGVARADGKVLNATWTFRGTELVVQDVHGTRLRATLSFDATAEPPAFRGTRPESARSGSSGRNGPTSCAWPSMMASIAAPRTSVPATSWWC